MQARDLLLNRKSEITAEIEKLNAEMAEIDRMLSAVGGASQPQARAVAGQGATQPEGDVAVSTKDEAILSAVRAGNRTPAQISQYIREKIGVDVNDASTRTRLSRMKAAGKISHDGFGWKLDK